MPVTPDNCYGVVTLFDDVGGEHVFGDLADVEDLTAVHFVDAGGTLALET